MQQDACHAANKGAAALSLQTAENLLICGMQLILLSAGSSYVRPGPAVVHLVLWAW